MRVSRKHHHCVLLYVGLTTSLLCIGCSPAEGQRLEADEVPTTSPEHGTLRAFQQQAVAEHAVERAELVRQLAKEGRGNGQTKTATHRNGTIEEPVRSTMKEVHQSALERTSQKRERSKEPANDSVVLNGGGHIRRIAKEYGIAYSGAVAPDQKEATLSLQLNYSVQGEKFTFEKGHLILGMLGFN